MNVSDLYGTLYSPGDGTVEPSEYVHTLSRAAKKLGGQIFEHTCLIDFDISTNISGTHYINGVITNNGYIKTKSSIMWWCMVT